MMRLITVLALVLSSGCAMVATLTPGSNSDKGVWVAKSTALFGLQMSNQEVYFCTLKNGTAPQCTKASE